MMLEVCSDGEILASRDGFELRVTDLPPLLKDVVAVKVEGYKRVTLEDRFGETTYYAPPYELPAWSSVWRDAIVACLGFLAGAALL